MRRRMGLAAIVFSVLSAAATCDAAAPRAVPEARLAEIVKAAPAMPAELDLGLKTHLIDFIDCTDAADPHDMLDQGTSRVVTGAAGKYRVTAGHHHAFFSYAYRTAGRDQPVLLVIEYPDDAERIISFMTHDSMRAVREHTSFGLETGVYCGGAMPLTNKMQYFTLINWPQDDWSPLVTLNWTRRGGAGAASRIWVYAIDEFSELAVEPPDPANPRTLDMFFCLSFLATRDNFGWESPKAIEHMAHYCKLLGINRVTMEVYYAPGAWGPACTIPAWDSGEAKDLDGILGELDRVGGVGLIAGFVTDGMYGSTVAGGRNVSDMKPEEAREVILKGVDQFIDRYGKYKSLAGIALGSMETIGFFDLLQSKGIVAEVVAHIRKRRPDFEVLTYVGNIRLQTPHFSGRQGAPTAWDVISGWETPGQSEGSGSWSAFLAGKVEGNWRMWKHLPADLKKIPGLHVYEESHPDDHCLHDVYPTHDPRQRFYFDVVRSEELSRAADTPYAAIFSTFTEGHIGLDKNLNFHYTKLWTGPDFNAAGSYGAWPFAQAVANRDRLAISAGTWNVKYFGLESQVRRFARAFRSLPPVEMKPVDIMASTSGPSPWPPDVVVARWASYKGKGYLSLVNRTPFACSVTVDGKTISLPSYELVTLVNEKSVPPGVSVGNINEHCKWVRERIAALQQLCDEVAALDPLAVPEAYRRTADQALALLEAGRPYAADTTLGVGLASELQLRKEILTRPEIKAPRVKAAPPMNGNLDAWPAEAGDLTLDDAELLPAHIFYPNSWTGPDDLSMRLRLAHDGQKLYFGIGVRDQNVTVDTVDSRGNKVSRKDSVTVMFSREKYCDWRSQMLPFDIKHGIAAPIEKPEWTGGGPAGLTYTVRRTATGYVVEGSAPLGELGAVSGKAIGFMLMAGDVDNTLNLMHSSSWAQKSSMLYPHQPNFEYWSDARNCGRLVLAP